MPLKRPLIYISCIFFILIIFFLSGVIYSPKPPEKEINMMNEAIAAARRNNAVQYAEKDFSMCLSLYDSVMNEWRIQNGLWVLKRNFVTLKKLVTLTTQAAYTAGEKAVEMSGSVNNYIEENVEELKKRDLDFRTKFKNFPFDTHILKEHSASNMLLLEAIQNAERGDIMNSYEKLVEAETGYTYIESEASNLLTGYFRSFDTWKNWYDETIRYSKTKSAYVIIVDKIRHKCFLVKNGKIIREYDAELSPKWIGNKLYAGDNVTPEGKYVITKKLGPKNTMYHKALLINYPNESDRKRYHDAVKAGAVPSSRGMGGLIEIHGNGGKGKDWTSGCVALTDKNMDQIFSMVSVGTPVTIVGSTVPLNELFTDTNE